MLEVFSLNLPVATDAAIPLNNVSIRKGCTVVNSAPATIQLNKCGVYMITCDASAAATTDGVVSIEMTKNGTLQPQAQSSFTGTADDINTLGFTTLVQVSENNTNCCCTSPTLIQIVNTGVPVTFSNINVCVTKIC